MRQALTADGILSVWYASAQSALEKNDVKIQKLDVQDRIVGEHPEYGLIEILFLHPVPEKTRMEIRVSDPDLYTLFKNSVKMEYVRINREGIQDDSDEESKTQIQSDEPVSALPDDQPMNQENETPETDTEEIQSEDQADELPEQETDLPQEQEELSNEEGEDEAAAPESFSESDPQSDEPVSALPDDQPMDQENETPETDTEEIQSEDQEDELPKQETDLPQEQEELSNKESDEPKESESDSEKERRKLSMMIIGGIAFVLLVIALAFGVPKESGTDDPTQPVDPVTPTTEEPVTETPEPVLPPAEGVVTLGMYDQVKNGMKFEEVCDLMTKEGILLQETTYKDDNGKKAKLQIYYWPGKANGTSNTTVTFKNGVVLTKSQYGLK